MAGMDGQVKIISSYKYCVVEFLPNLESGETVNIGIIIHDKQTKKLIGRFTKNTKEIKRRTIGANAGVAELLKVYFKDKDFERIEEDLDYLTKERKREKGTYCREFFSDIRGGIIIDGKHDLEWSMNFLYDHFITIDKLGKKK